MTGVILCGGLSTRMGTDKGLLTHDGKTWAQHAIDKLAALNMPVVCSINAQQAEAYAEHINVPLIIDDSMLDIGGPLKGILSAHLQYPDEDLFLLACDLRDMHADVLQHLYYKHEADADSVHVFAREDFDEPLCGIYSFTTLCDIYDLYQQDLLIKHSMQYALKQVDVNRLSLPLDWIPYFKNYNTL